MEQCQDPALPQLHLLSSLLPLQRPHRLEKELKPAQCAVGQTDMPFELPPLSQCLPKTSRACLEDMALRCEAVINRRLGSCLFWACDETMRLTHSSTKVRKPASRYTPF